MIDSKANIARYTVIITPEMWKRYLMARAGGLVKGRDMQLLMRTRFEEILDSLFMKNKNADPVESIALIINKNMERTAQKEKLQGDDTDMIETEEVFGMFNR